MSAFDLGEGMFPVPLWQAGAVNIESQQRFRTIHSQPHACIRCRFLIQSVTRRLTAAVLRTRRCGPFDSRRRRRNPHPIPAKIPGPARSEPLTSLVAAPWLRRRAVDGAEGERAERVPRAQQGVVDARTPKATRREIRGGTARFAVLRPIALVWSQCRFIASRPYMTRVKSDRGPAAFERQAQAGTNVPGRWRIAVQSGYSVSL